MSDLKISPSWISKPSVSEYNEKAALLVYRTCKGHQPDIRALECVRWNDGKRWKCRATKTSWCVGNFMNFSQFSTKTLRKLGMIWAWMFFYGFWRSVCRYPLLYPCSWSGPEGATWSDTNSALKHSSMVAMDALEQTILITESSRGNRKLMEIATPLLRNCKYHKRLAITSKSGIALSNLLRRLLLDRMQGGWSTLLLSWKHVEPARREEERNRKDSELHLPILSPKQMWSWQLASLPIPCFVPHKRSRNAQSAITWISLGRVRPVTSLSKKVWVFHASLAFEEFWGWVEGFRQTNHKTIIQKVYCET